MTAASLTPGNADERTVDVIVVGGGGAGLAAASAARQGGASVVLLEKNPSLGGTTAWSVGSVSATRTTHQRRAGIDDDPHDHWEDLQKFSGAQLPKDNVDLGRVLCEGMPEAFAWLQSTGLEFIGPMPEPPHRRNRMHCVIPNSRAFPDRLGRHCARIGVDIRLDTRVESLLFDGEVASGVRATSPAGTTTWRARGGVVLAAGDFAASPELKARFATALAAKAEAVNATSTGDGIAMGLDAGGVVVNGDNLRGPFLRFVPPAKRSWLTTLPAHRWLTVPMHWAFDHLPMALLRPFMMRFLTTALAPDRGLLDAGGMLVDRDGRLLSGKGINHHLAAAAAPGGLGYIVFDARVAKQFSAWPHFVSTAPGIAYAYLDDYKRTRRDICFEAPTLDALAGKMGLPSAALTASARQHDSAWAADHDGAAALAQGPFFALGPAKAYVVFTNGGLKVSREVEVLRADGTAIPGLYAAGSNGQGGMLLEGHGHHLGWAFVSGRIAGRNAAARAKQGAGTVRTSGGEPVAA